jgi:hypothetical protein
MSDDPTIGRMQRSMNESARQAERDAAAEAAKWKRCATPQPLMREDVGPSTRIIQVGKGARG